MPLGDELLYILGHRQFPIAEARFAEAQITT
jgi:hypothetical protein